MYINTEKWYRVLWKNIDTKYLNWKRKIIFTSNEIKNRSIWLDFLQNIENIFKIKYFYFIKFDIEKFYLSIIYDVVCKILKSLSVKKFWILTKLVKDILWSLKKYKKYIFMSNEKWLFLGNYIWKLLSYLVSLYISMKLSWKVVFVFEDDFLILYKKDKRLDLEKKIDEIVYLLEKFNFSLSLKKLQYGIFKKDIADYLWFSFQKWNIYISEEKIKQRKYRFVWIINDMKIYDGKILNLKTIWRKIRYWFYWFNSYYKLARNIGKVQKELSLFVRKLIRYLYKKKTWKNMFEVNMYLNNKKLDFIL